MQKRLTPQPPLHFVKPSETKPSSYASGNATSLLVNRSQTFQEIEGFGGAFTDSASHVFDSMPAVLQEQLIEMYFGPTGLQYNMGRLTIGSCDFSLEYYNYDDTKGDTNLTHLTYPMTKQNYTLYPACNGGCEYEPTFGCLSLECACLDEKEWPYELRFGTMDMCFER